ncbi:carbohydrate-binding protein [Arthrobacter sp. CAL618]|uniref:carbohydrate-binding protein n=1 Tax=Arthrobacter sp. CAL618 TaxID=1055770 RepID=UPI0004661FA3
MSRHFPGRKLSFVRLVLVIGVVAAVVAGSVTGWSRFEDARAAEDSGSWFAGYVDATATPFYAFERPQTEEGGSIVLSFVVADPESPCEPSWGAAYSFDEAESTMDLDRRIARLLQSGGEVAVSFGGLHNDELATSCTDVNDLKDAYASVVERYNLSTIDLDVEGENLLDTEAGERRAEAIALLQQERLAADEPLNVWLTLPVAPTGLTEPGTTAVTQMLEGGVDLAGVNIMTMDFGESRPETMSMLEASIAAAEATHSQLSTLYGRADLPLGPQALWTKLGLTPMIGQNDVVSEVFSLDHAAGLNAFAVEKGIGRMSMWSLNRDATCSDNYADVTVVSVGCSGIDQDGQSFAQLLGQEFEGTSETIATTSASPEPTPELVEDNPETSPYPIWSEDATYVAEQRVVWHGNVYVAKWWNEDSTPDNPVLRADETPWTLIGPVLPGEKPVSAPTVPAGTVDEWDPEEVYESGDLVKLDNHVFECKWWSQGDSPEAALQGSAGSPWDRLSNDDVTELLEGLEDEDASGPTRSATPTPTATRSESP